MRCLRPGTVHFYAPKVWPAGNGGRSRVPARIQALTELIVPSRKGRVRFVLAWADRLICPSGTRAVSEGAGVKRALERFASTRLTLRVIRHRNIACVDTAHFAPNDAELESTEWDSCLRLELAREAFVFCHGDRLDRDKGVAESAAALLDLSAWPHLVAVGELDEFSLVGRATKAQISRHERIRWLGFQQDLLSALRATDVIVLPSYREGFPGVLLEAGAMGMPAIAAGIAGGDGRGDVFPGERLRPTGRSARSGVSAQIDLRLHWQNILNLGGVASESPRHQGFGREFWIDGK